jgi:dTDP-glucose 4,6-dehydratase
MVIMKVFVTGGCGFIGSNFIRYMLSKHADVRITNLDKLTYAGNRENLSDVETNQNYSFVQGDICDKNTVCKLVKDSDVIVNFAAETHVDRSIMEPDSFVKTDILGTFTLIEAAKEFSHKRYIQISTDEVYGSIEKGSFTEKSPISPNSPYAASKASGELLALSYVKTYKFPAIIIRSSNNFGPYQYPEKLIPLFVTNALQDKPLPLYGEGKNVRDWLYVLDNCEAIDLVLRKGKTGEIYNVGGGNEVTNIEITRKILSILGKPETLVRKVEDRMGHDWRYSLDCSKIRNELGWKPKFDFSKAIEETILWYKNNPNWWTKIKEKQREYREFYCRQYKTIE